MMTCRWPGRVSWEGTRSLAVEVVGRVQHSCLRQGGGEGDCRAPLVGLWVVHAVGGASIHHKLLPSDEAGSEGVGQQERHVGNVVPTAHAACEAAQAMGASWTYILRQGICFSLLKSYCCYGSKHAENMQKRTKAPLCVVVVASCSPQQPWSSGLSPLPKWSAVSIQPGRMALTRGTPARVEAWAWVRPRRPALAVVYAWEYT